MAEYQLRIVLKESSYCGLLFIMYFLLHVRQRQEEGEFGKESQRESLDQSERLTTALAPCGQIVNYCLSK